MMSERRNPASGPTPEEIGAHVDRELHGAERARVEAWLACHPTDAAAANAWRRIDELFQATTPPEPAPAKWETTLGRIVRSEETKKKRLPWRTGTGVALIAAATLALTLWPRGDRADKTQPFPVAEREDIVILRIFDDDRALVAAPAPIDEQFQWAGQGDVWIKDCKRDADGMVAKERMNGGLMLLSWEP